MCSLLRGFDTFGCHTHVQQMSETPRMAIIVHTTGQSGPPVHFGDVATMTRSRMRKSFIVRC